MALFTVAGGRGEPPADTTLRLDRSSWGSRGLLTSSVTIVEAKLVQDTCSRSAIAPCRTFNCGSYEGKDTGTCCAEHVVHAIVTIVETRSAHTYGRQCVA